MVERKVSGRHERRGGWVSARKHFRTAMDVGVSAELVNRLKYLQLYWCFCWVWHTPKA